MQPNEHSHQQILRAAESKHEVPPGVARERGFRSLQWPVRVDRVEDTSGAIGVDGETTSNGMVKARPQDGGLLMKVSKCHVY